MNLHEYQAKALLRAAHLPVPTGEVVTSVDAVPAVLQRLGCERWVVKAQIHAGGRGKAGGVVLVDQAEEAVKAVQRLLGTRLVTYQTDAQGQPVDRVLIEAPSAIATELYLGAVVDREQQKIVFMASTEGGVDIETVAHETPEKILKVAVDPLVGVQPYQCRQLAFGLGLTGGQIREFAQILTGLGQLFIERDLSLLEINPLVITQAGKLVCLDAKINIDDNALYRQAEIRELRDTAQEDERENRAHEWSLNYIALEGDIGCMVNGAGLAMATMDLIKLLGGSPANFLDVGGGATQERVAEAFKIILSDQQVKGVLVNIFGGIVRCDLIAEGIIKAVEEVAIDVPVVVRLVGNRADLGSEKLASSGLNIVAETDLTTAAQKVIELTKSGVSA